MGPRQHRARIAVVESPPKPISDAGPDSVLRHANGKNDVLAGVAPCVPESLAEEKPWLPHSWNPRPN